MIESYSFGKMTIDGKLYTKDLKIIDGAVVPEWWRGNGHKVSITDIQDILAAKPDVLVLGKGKPGLMKSDAELKALLQKKGIELIEQSSSKAVATFNTLSNSGRKVCAGFHLTC